MPSGWTPRRRLRLREARRLAPVGLAVVLTLTACAGPTDATATQTCPTPRLGAAPGDLGPSRPLAARAVYHPDDDPQQSWDVSVVLDNGTGRPLEEVAPCQALVVSLFLEGPSSSTPYGTPEDGAFELSTQDGRGRLHLVDQATYVEQADDGSGAQDYGVITGWYLTADDLAAGEYRQQREFTWYGSQGHEESAGVVDLVLRVG